MNPDPAKNNGWFQSRVQPSARAPAKSKPSGSWQCGDSRRVKQIVSQFTKSSTLHGLQYVCSRDTSFLKRLFHRLFFAFMLVGMLYSVAILVRESFGKESVYLSKTSKEVENGPSEDPSFFPEFPRIIVCRKPAYRMDVNASERRLLEYAFIPMGFTSLTPEEKGYLVEIHRSKKRLLGLMPLSAELKEYLEGLDKLKERYDRLKESDPRFDLTKFIVRNGIKCRDIFKRCLAVFFPVDCCILFRQKLTSLGNCFELALEKQFIAEALKKARLLSFQFIFDLHAVPPPDRSSEMGYEVRLWDPRNRQLAFAPTGGYSLINGFTTVMRTRLVKTSRIALYTPRHGFWHECPRLHPDYDSAGYGERYFRQACDDGYMMKTIREACDCRYVTDTGNTSVPVCDPVHVYGCFIKRFAEGGMNTLREECPSPCIDYDYVTEVNYEQIAGNGSRLIFSYDGVHYSLNEYRKTTLSEVLSQIGGALGLYLGASIITSGELIIFMVVWIWYRIMPHRRHAVFA